MEVFKKIGSIRGVSSSFLNIGNIYCLKGDYEAALMYYKQSKEIAEKIEDNKNLSECLISIGVIYQEKGDYDNALKGYQKSMEIKEKIKDIKGVASILNNIGNIYYLKKDYDEALRQYQKSLKICEKIGDIVDVASSYGQMGSLHLQKEDYPTALSHFIKALLIYAKTGSPQIKVVLNGILLVREKVPEAEFAAILKEFGLTPEMFEGRGTKKTESGIVGNWHACSTKLPEVVNVKTRSHLPRSSRVPPFQSIGEER